MRRMVISLPSIYHLDGKEIGSIEGSRLSKLITDLDRLGVPHKELKIDEIDCTCKSWWDDGVRTRIDYQTCPYHKNHTGAGFPVGNINNV
jgi:hypothetical protein